MKKALVLFMLLSGLCFADRIKIIKSESLEKLENEINYFIQDKEIKDIKIQIANEEILKKLISISSGYEISKNYIAYIIY